MRVIALHDIVTENGFRVAKSGDVGRSVKNVLPHDVRNVGKVFVLFNNRKHGYWVKPDELTFCGSLDKSEYLATTWFGASTREVTNIPSNDKHFDYHFGKNLKLCRQARNLSQSELGERMGKHGTKLAQSTICYRENKQHSPNGKFIDAAAKALNIPAFIFFVPMSEETWFTDAKSYIANLSSNICGE